MEKEWKKKEGFEIYMALDQKKENITGKSNKSPKILPDGRKKQRKTGGAEAARTRLQKRRFLAPAPPSMACERDRNQGEPIFIG